MRVAGLALGIVAAVALSAGQARPASRAASHRIVFVAYGGAPFDALDVVNANGSGVKTLRSFGTGLVRSPTWSPDGRRIAFSVQPVSGVGATVLYVMNADGSGLRTVASGYTSADWSPNGAKLAVEGAHGIYVVSPGGGHAARIVAGRALQPAWSPDGTQIAFMRILPDAGTEIVVARSNGSAQHVLIRSCPPACTQANVVPGVRQPPAGLESPAWSPDGKTIAFGLGVFVQGACRGCYLPEIATIGADGTGVKLLTRVRPPTANESPSWSADGTQIAFTHALCYPKTMCSPNEGDARSVLGAMNANGTAVRTVARRPALEPAWQP